MFTWRSLEMLSGFIKSIHALASSILDFEYILGLLGTTSAVSAAATVPSTNRADVRMLERNDSTVPSTPTRSEIQSLRGERTAITLPLSYQRLRQRTETLSETKLSYSSLINADKCVYIPIEPCARPSKAHMDTPRQSLPGLALCCQHLK